MKKLILFICAVSSFAMLAKGETYYLFKDGQKRWSISYETPADSQNHALQLAARELERVFRVSSGVKENAGVAGKKTEVTLGIDTKLKEEEISICVEDDKLRLRGGSPSAALHAAYYFLQKGLGVKWLFPGPAGEFIPKKKVCRFTEKLKVRHVPSVKYRGFHMCGQWYKVEEFREWMARNFVNIHRHGLHFPGDQRFVRMWSDHNVRVDQRLFETHPEYFALYRGKRVKTQPCLSHPEVDRIIYDYFAWHLRKSIHTLRFFI